MKNLLILFTILVTLLSAQPAGKINRAVIPVRPAGNLIIITIDGFRWQEIFTGADRDLINDPSSTPDTATMKMLYWVENEKERRRKLMPFLWSIIATKGQLYGNRHLDNRVNTANLYAVSYPGYNELLTGHTDIMVSSNRKRNNDNVNVLEYLNNKEAFRGKIAAFTSWDVFPYIFNEERSRMMVNSGYENICIDSSRGMQEMINRVQSAGVYNKGGTRYDQLTYLTAREYLSHYQPRIVFLGLGETDDFAHQGRYDLYLEQANKIDRMIAELWHWVQTTPGYRDNTNILVTTDHGRGSRDSKWTSHSTFIKGSSQTWLALIGPGIEPQGEMREGRQLYQQEIAGTIARLVGGDF